MRRRTAASQARCDDVLHALRAGAIWRVNNIASEVGITPSQARVACGYLEEDGLIERLTGMALGRLLTLGDGRRIWVGPPCGSVGYRIRETNDLLPELEALWAMS